jgi:hypothetical protein
VGKALALLCILAACGRVDFDSRGLACALSATTPDPVRLSGTTFYYTSFNNTTAPVVGTRVSALTEVGGSMLAQGTSNAGGAYSLSIPTGGAPRSLALLFEADNYVTTSAVPDLPVDRDITAQHSLWSTGDGPLWSPSALDSVYGAAGVVRRPALSTINVSVVDCAGNTIEGVAVAFDPAPERAEYLASNGPPSPSLTSTVAPYTAAVAFNAPPGPTRVSAAKSGLVFLDQTLMISGGEVTITVMRSVE